MRVLGVKPGHDGAVALIEDGELRWCLEAEKDSMPRHSELSAEGFIRFVAATGVDPDVVAIGGWLNGAGRVPSGAGYRGTQCGVFSNANVFGKAVRVFSSTHERSHIMAGVAMSPFPPGDPCAVLLWEGDLGAFYVVDAKLGVQDKYPVLAQPGDRYAFLFDLADREFSGGRYPRPSSSGKLMALAAYGEPDVTNDSVDRLVNSLLSPKSRRIHTNSKQEFSDSVFYNIGVEHPWVKSAASQMENRIFNDFADVATSKIPSGLPLVIVGGCGLNCGWNRRWRDLGHFSSVFVPPCPNDAGSAIGTAFDAYHQITGEDRINWNVYSGLSFERDIEFPASEWLKSPFHPGALAQTIMANEVVAWAQGKWEIGPRALGHRSLLANPFDGGMKARLNLLKHREEFRPIAPAVRVEDLDKLFDSDFLDPHMLYFRRVCTGLIPAVTHVDGSARVQSVAAAEVPRLHELLTAVSVIAGVGVLCNTSLNWPGRGFINRMSDLKQFVDANRVNHVVVDRDWYARRSLIAGEQA